MVQNSSKGWDSIIILFTCVLSEVEIIVYIIIIVIIVRIVIIWSWKKISSSIKGEQAFWKLKDAKEEISKRIKIIHKWSLNSVHYSAIIE